MRICPKCGKANDVTRKYCVRCGSSLIKDVEDPTFQPEPSTAMDKVEMVSVPQQPEPEVKERHVRPSEIASDRVRTAERHIEKTEFEKAQEAFARSEEADERMLRASELRELQAEVHRESEPRPPPREPTVPQEPSTPSSNAVQSPLPPQAEPTQVEYEEGQEVVKQILRRVKEAETRAKTSAGAPGSEIPADRPPAPATEIDERSPSEVPRLALEPEAVVEAPATSPVQPPSVEVPSAPRTEAASESVVDSRVRQYETDIKALTIEKGHLETELVTLQNRLDEDVERARIESETKRTRVEAIERELRLAKKEHSDAKKELKKAENRRKKEISNAKKRIRATEKKIDKAASAREKRLREVEKERLKSEAER